MVSLPQYRRPPLSGDSTSQHGALANRYSGDAHFLVIWKGEQVHIWWREEEIVNVRWEGTWLNLSFETLNETAGNNCK